MKLAVTLPLTKAASIVDTVLTTARRESMLPITVVVLDCVGMGISSRLIRDRLSARPVFQNSLATASDGQLIPVPGGVLIENTDGQTIGAVGVSGDTSQKDEYCAITAIQKAGFASEPRNVDDSWQTSSLSDHDDQD